MANRPVFSSHFATVLTLVGVAVGLGNVWRFPYMMGKYGGSAFLFVYLLFTLLFAIPALMGEVALGKAARSGLVGAFTNALGNLWGRTVGYLLLGTILVASSYYVIVIANVFYSAYFATQFDFGAETVTLLEQQLGNGWLQYGLALFLLAASLFILLRGLQGGIEPVSKLFMPIFLVVILFLIVSAFRLEGARYHFFQFLRPDFSALKAQHVFAALGQAFYSLSLGGTFMVVYGSYIKDREQIPRLAVLTSIGDVGAALLASLFIVPTILVFGLDMTSGPRLIFSTLPHLFGVMPGGQWAGVLFMLALGLAALLSLIAALEVATSGFMEIFDWSRGTTLLAIGVVEALLAFPSAFDADVIGVLDLVFGSGMQVLGSGLALIALTWGLGKTKALNQLFGRERASWHAAYFRWIKWVVPGILLAVLIGYIYSIAIR